MNNNKVWLIVKEEDFFYDDKYTEIDVFNTYEDAKKFFNDYLEILLYDLEKEYGDQDIIFTDAIELDTFSNGEGTRIYLEDSYYITLEIQEKEVMRF